MQITLSEWQKPEHVKIIAPIIGVIFAVLFEIGFFSSIGLGWFTFFPLSNHIEFALESLPLALEPIQEDLIHEQGLGLVKRLSIMRIMARRTKAATVLA